MVSNLSKVDSAEAPLTFASHSPNAPLKERAENVTPQTVLQASREAPSAPAFTDDRVAHCITFINERLASDQRERGDKEPEKPFFIGINGIQGIGKTTLVSALDAQLRTQGFRTLVFSIDDLYLPRDEQQKLAKQHPECPLVQHRGEPGTHDMVMARAIFEALKNGEQTRIPEYNKAAYNGEGDRVAPEHWRSVNAPGDLKPQVVIFEGWCVGFKSLSEEDIRHKQKQVTETLNNHRTEDLLLINENLRLYDIITDTFDAFIHIDAKDLKYVYEWRKEQERGLIKKSGMGMTENQVIAFVNNYYPAYELYMEGVQRGVLLDRLGEQRQLRLVCGQNRKVEEVCVI